MFETTLPLGEPDLMRASDFQRYLDSMLNGPADGDPLQARMPSLSPSVLQDLVRFERDGRQSEVLEVLAASLRHVQPLTLHLQWLDQVLPLTVFPPERLVHCPLAQEALLDGRLADLQVLQVEPATLQAPGQADASVVAPLWEYAPLAPLLWAMAMRGGRDNLLPELAGHAAFRVAPVAHLDGLELGGVVAATVARLRRQPTSLREMSDWPGMNRERAARLLNAIYLLAGLIVSRSHPAAASDSWYGAR